MQLSSIIAVIASLSAVATAVKVPRAASFVTWNAVGCNDNTGVRTEHQGIDSDECHTISDVSFALAFNQTGCSVRLYNDFNCADESDVDVYQGPRDINQCKDIIDRFSYIVRCV